MTNKLTNSLLVVAVGGLMFASAAAQTTTQANPGTTPPPASSPSGPTGANNVNSGPGVDDQGHPRINQLDNRQQNQQNRVSNDIKDGKMTPGQAAQVEKQDARIENQEKADIAKDGGRHITKAQQRQINREQTRVSRKINKDQKANK
ncbi:MAG TPA: hypothetical protein VIH58_00800 [Chthoniobacterales bacterium]|jgi:hypothetical protein